MHSTVPAALLATLLAAGAIQPAAAADISPAGADALQSQMQGWLERTLGPGVLPPGNRVQVRPEGDQYRIELPLGTPRAGQPGPVTLSALARPEDDGRWTFQGPELPSPTHFMTVMPTPPRRGQSTPGPDIPIEYTITVGSQDSRGTYDPSFATPSTLTNSARDVQVRAQSALADQLTKTERSSGVSTLRPSGPDRIDWRGEATIEGYSSTSRFQDAPPVELSAQQVRTTGEITALSRDRVAAVLPVVARIASGFLARASTPDGSSPAPVPTDPQSLRTIVQSLRDFASEFTSSDTFNGVVFRSGPNGGAASQFRVGLNAKSEGGLLRASMDLGLDGLVLSNPALEPFAGLLPRRIALHPVLMGVSTEEVLQWLDAASDAESARTPGFAALFRRGGVSAGLDSFAVDIGGTSLAGTGTLTALSPDSLAGEAQVTAANFDDLIARVNAAPGLASVLPFLIFAKGVSQTVGGHLVWNLAFRDNKLLVNGADLSAMTGRSPAQGPKNR